jgi:hypothetical protein
MPARISWQQQKPMIAADRALPRSPAKRRRCGAGPTTRSIDPAPLRGNAARRDQAEDANEKLQISIATGPKLFVHWPPELFWNAVAARAISSDANRLCAWVAAYRHQHRVFDLGRGRLRLTSGE